MGNEQSPYAARIVPCQCARTDRGYTLSKERVYEYTHYAAHHRDRTYRVADVHNQIGSWTDKLQRNGSSYVLHGGSKCHLYRRANVDDADEWLGRGQRDLEQVGSARHEAVK